MKIFVDTNIIFDYLQKERGKHVHKSAVELVVACCDNNIEMVIGSSQITDIYYSLRKLLGKYDAAETLRNLFSIFSIVDTRAESCRKAIDSSIDDFEDAVQEETAKYYGCTWVITRDKDFIADSPMTILPEEFTLLVEEENNKK